MTIDYERSLYTAMSRSSCTTCDGSGARLDNGAVCACVWRSVFRVCFRRYKELTLIGVCGRDFSYSDFRSDFYLVSKRTLSNPIHWAVFKSRFLEDEEYNLCCRKLTLSRGNYYHNLYRVESLLGQAFTELRPIPIFPLGAYFESAHKKDVRPFAVASDHSRTANGPVLRAPLARRRRNPVVVLMVPDPVPVPKLNTGDPAEVESYCRQRLRDGVSLRLIATELTRLSGDWWLESRVKRLLLSSAQRAA